MAGSVCTVAIRLLTDEAAFFATLEYYGELNVDGDTKNGTFKADTDAFTSITSTITSVCNWFYDRIADPVCDRDIAQIVQYYGTEEFNQISHLDDQRIKHISIFSRIEYYDEPFGASLLEFDVNTKSLSESHRDTNSEDYGEDLETLFRDTTQLSIGEESANAVIQSSEDAGDTNVIFGDITWKKLAVTDDRMLLFSEKSLTKMPYNKKCIAVTWETCTLRNWLNGDFIKKHFSDEERTRIIVTENLNPGNSVTGVLGGNNTQDKVFLLSIEDLDQYLSRQENRSDGTYWRLRTPADGLRNTLCITPDGSILDDDGWVEFDYGVRPAMWVRRSNTI